MGKLMMYLFYQKRYIMKVFKSHKFAKVFHNSQRRNYVPREDLDMGSSLNFASNIK